MNYEFTTVGALIGLAVAIILIIKKLQPAYSLILGALIGGVIGSGGAAGLEIKERMKLIPYEMCVGLTSTVVAVIMYVV